VPDLRINQEIGAAARVVTDEKGNASSLALSQNEVGIGTTAPRAVLHIEAPAPADANSAQLLVTATDGRTLMVGRTEDYGFIQSHNRQPLALNPLGNSVGIGTGTPQATLDVRGSISVTEDIILAGADCAEEFECDPEGSSDAGTVMVASAGNRLVHCSTPYDRRVAGIVSGQHEHRPAIVLGRKLKTDQAQRIQLALIGTVLCKAEAESGAIEIGTLLTTSSRRGHAMCATDPIRAFGAIVGKALEPLCTGTGLIRVLVTLQ